MVDGNVYPILGNVKKLEYKPNYSAMKIALTSKILLDAFRDQNLRYIAHVETYWDNNAIVPLN